MTDEIRRYTSDDIDVTYEVKRCIHASECVRGLPAVFDRQKRPWVQPGNAESDALADVIMRCPSGALHFERKNGGAAEPIPVQNIIIPTLNGPLYVRGNIRITNVSGGVELQDTRLALCRCGASGNKPFCDNSHRQVEFQDEGQVTDNQVKVEAVAEHRPLDITPKPNGPLRLLGDFEIRSADGQTVFRGKEMTLCRCGGSSHKPFCDDTHKRIGFTDAR